MAPASLLDQSIGTAQAMTENLSAERRQEFGLLLQDLQEAKTTLFVRTSEARPLLERIVNAANALQATGATWNEAAEDAYDEFESAVRKLRNTILVRTQRAT